MPALLLGELDRQRGNMTVAQIAIFSSTTQTLIGNLTDIVVEEAEEPSLESVRQGSDGDERYGAMQKPGNPDLPNGGGKSVLCVGGRGTTDDAAAAMIAQVLAAQGTTVSQATHHLLAGRNPDLLTAANADGLDTVLIAFLNIISKAHARQVIRRLKRVRPSLRVGLFVPATDDRRSKPMEAEDLGADFVSTNIAAAVQDALVPDVTVKPASAPKRLRGARLHKTANVEI